jgi:hypothetical protein
MTVSADGKSMTILATDAMTDHATAYVAIEQ